MMSTISQSFSDWSQKGGASSWNKLFDRYYRKLELYSMQWEEQDLGKIVIAASPFAGPIGTFVAPDN